MIVTFLGASILNIVGGIPFLPLQTLWVNFTTQVFQSIGLGYGEPSEGLMERRPRKPDAADPDAAPTRAGSSSPASSWRVATLGGDRRRRGRRGRRPRAHDGR